MNIIGGLFNFVGAVFKYTFWTGVTIVAGGLAVSFLTKPTDDSFNNFLKDRFKDTIGTPLENKDPVIGLIKNIAATFVPTVVDFKINDYVLVKIAHVKTGKEAYYVGTFNNWFLLDQQK
jgi:hypothetical protein